MNSEQLGKLEKKIAGLKKVLESEYWHIGYRSDDYTKDELKDMETGFYEGAKRLYMMVFAYLEAMGLPEFLMAYKEKFEAAVKDKKEVMKWQSLFVGSQYDPSCKFLDDIETFLSPFFVFDHNYKEDSEIALLENILRNTDKIVAKTKVKAIKEATIYKEVKWYLELVFPKIRHRHTARFISKFKTYHPDILIPEIKTSVEYKLIKNEAEIGNYIDQLKTDADNYEGDLNYEKFYAVVYFKKKSTQSEKAIL